MSTAIADPYGLLLELRETGDITDEQFTSAVADLESRIDVETPPEWFHEGQLEAWASPAMVVAIFAGWQSGKSVVGARWLLREIFRKGPGDYGAAAPTYPLMSKKMLPEFKAIFKRFGTYSISDRIFTFSPEGERALWGSVQDVPTKVYFGHMDDADSLEAATYKAFWGDENGQDCVSVEVYEVVKSRLAVNSGRVLWTSRPYNLGPYYELVWCRATYRYEHSDDGNVHRLGEKDAKEIAVICFSSIQNPTYPVERYEEARAEMPPWRFALKYQGRPTRPAGAIYGCFDPDQDIVPNFKISRAWPRFVGVDFGGINVGAVFIAQELRQTEFGWGEPTGIYYAYREYRADEKLDTEVHVQHMMHGEGKLPDIAKGGNATSEDGWRNDFRSKGYPIGEPLVKGVESGINVVYGLLASGRLRILARCEKLKWELTNYSRDVDPETGETVEKIAKKSRYHLADALRYIAPNLTPGPNRVDEPRALPKTAMSMPSLH